MTARFLHITMCVAVLSSAALAQDAAINPFAELMDADPVERNRIMLKHWHQYYAKECKLDDNQKVKLQKEFDSVFSEYEKSLGANAARLRELDAQMKEFWQGQIKGENNDLGSLFSNEEFLRYSREMSELQQKTAFNWDNVHSKAEKVIPAQQFEKARRKLAASGNKQRRRQIRKDYEERQKLREPEILSKGRPLDEFERYVSQFVKRYNLDQAQRRSAESILRDIQERKRVVKRTQESVKSEIQGNQDMTEREKGKALQKLEGPIVELFEELKGRLDDLLTEEQRRADKAKQQPQQPKQ